MCITSFPTKAIEPFVNCVAERYRADAGTSEQKIENSFLMGSYVKELKLAEINKNFYSVCKSIFLKLARERISFYKDEKNELNCFDNVQRLCPVIQQLKEYESICNLFPEAISAGKELEVIQPDGKIYNCVENEFVKAAFMSLQGDDTHLKIIFNSLHASTIIKKEYENLKKVIKLNLKRLLFLPMCDRVIEHRNNINRVDEFIDKNLFMLQHFPVYKVLREGVEDLNSNIAFIPIDMIKNISKFWGSEKISNS